MKKAFNAFNHGTGKIRIESDNGILVMLPTEIHLKEDGSKKNEPSFAIVMRGSYVDAYGEISLEMLNDGLADIGYELIKK